jgi:anaerobic magnesium-protoporphyrin IX monomethyl ester cyclase
MKVLLIQPPIRDFYRTSIRTQPIGLAYLAASLREQDHEVAILDCQTGQRKSMPIPAELSYLKHCYPPYDRSPFKLYTGYYHFGMGWDEIRRCIEDSGAHVFGISSSFTPYHPEALEIARIIKTWDPKKWVVMGGAHVSCDPEGVLQSPFVDYVILGEGEYRFPFLLDKIERKVDRRLETDGIGRKVGGSFRISPLNTFIERLDAVSFPARDLLDLDRYRIGKKRSTMIITSRGCPHRCAYCSAHLVMGSSFRTRSPQSILEEMVECRQRHGIEVFDIEDDNFTFDRERAKQWMRMIIETFGEGRLELSAMNGISFAALDRELLGLMKKAGFKTVNLSFVSTEPILKEKMRRPGLSIDFDQVLREVEATGLGAVVYAIYGMPGQRVEEMVDTLIYLMGKRVLIGPSIYYPTPGTRLFRKCKEGGMLPFSPSQWRSSAFPIETKQFSRLDLVTLFRLSRIINFIKAKVDEEVLEEGLTWKKMVHGLKNWKEREPRGIGGSQEAVTAALRRGRADSPSWIDLLRQAVERRSFPAVRRLRDGTFAIDPLETSGKVLDYFLERANDQPLLGTRKS